MAQLAGAYAAQGKNDKANALYSEIDSLYPGSQYHAAAVAGKAALSLKAGKIDEALAMVQPLVAKANENISPSPDEGAIFASAFLVEGQALEAKKQLQKALEDYLTVKTMFYQDPVIAEQAAKLADNLRSQNPGLGIE